MAKRKLLWRKGRGKLGIFDPLIGTWTCTTDSPMGKVTCTRTFKSVLNDKFIQLTVGWRFTKSTYEELALFGVNNGKVAFWSFTSDGKRSEGALVRAADVHAEAVCFEAQMPAGLARMIYWPHPEGGFHWAVESKAKKGWNRFVEHHYRSRKPVK